MAKRLTQSEFIEKCNKVHLNKYDYSNTKYINNRTKINVICKIHGEFEINASNHSMGQGCSKCVLDKHKLITISDERLKKMKLVHNDKYIYDNLEVKNGKIEIICPIHGKFNQIIFHHDKGSGCYQCALDMRKVVKYRVCRYCEEKKSVDNFDSKFKTCKSCLVNKPVKDYKKCNKCGIKKEISDFSKKSSSIDGLNGYCKECIYPIKKLRRKEYYKNNKVKLKLSEKIYRKTRMKSDPLYRAKMDARNIIRKSISKMGYTKKSKTYEILGCSYIEFKNHLESLFLDGMTWDNRDVWHIDHIVPVSFAKSEEELLIINNYKNLRPLWEFDNLSKGDDITIKNEIYDKIISMRS